MHATTDRTRAVLPVHVFGRPCRIEPIVAHARHAGLAIIEDSCEGLGSSVDGRPLGSFGDIAVFAFYPNKQITTGEGGMVVTDDPALADVMRSLRNQGRDTDGTWLRHVRLGYNYRLDELSAAVGVAQVERLAELRRGATGWPQRTSAASAAGTGSACRKAGPGESVDWFVYVVRLDPAIDRDAAHRPARRTSACRRGPTSARSTSSRSTARCSGTSRATSRSPSASRPRPWRSRSRAGSPTRTSAYVCEAIVEAASAA